MSVRTILFCLGVVLALALHIGPGPALGSPSPATLRVELFRDGRSALSYIAVLHMLPSQGWYAYGPTPGPTGLPTHIQATLNGDPITTRYPAPERKPDPLDPSLEVELYSGPTPFFFPLEGHGDVALALRFEALFCSDKSCQPLRETLTINATASELATAPLASEQAWWPTLGASQSLLPDPSTETTTPRLDADVPASAPPEFSFTPRYFAPGLEVRTLSKAAAFAALAGLILNFMPCVLPVITLKLRSFIPTVGSISKEQRRTFRAHNLFFALGMLIYFFLLAVLIAMTGMAWGQIFQQPSAIIVLTAVVFALALSLFGIYDLPLVDLKGKSTGPHHPRLESFVTGVLATILATPCSGPFLGGVLAWALIQPPEIIALVLSCIGLGMAAPYLIMALFPGLYRFLPQAGPWTVHLERILGFLLVGTCVYLLGLLPESSYLDVLILLLAIAFAAWIWGQWTNLSQSSSRRWTIRACALVLVAGVAFMVFRPVTAEHVWRPFDMSRFEAARGRRHVLLEFTADWCPNCKFLEKTVLTPEKSITIADKYNAELFRVDLTRHDPTLMRLLESLGSKSIPVLAIFPRHTPESPLVLRDLFTENQLCQALATELTP